MPSTEFARIRGGLSCLVLPKLPILKKILKSILKTATNGEQQLLFQDQVKPLVNTAKNRIAHLMMIA